jgi:hypothetical protein
MSYLLSYIYTALLPQVIALIISVALGIWILHSGRIAKFWAFLTPIATTLIITFVGAVLVNDPMGSAIHVMESAILGAGTIIVNAIILWIYLKKS